MPFNFCPNCANKLNSNDIEICPKCGMRLIKDNLHQMPLNFCPNCAIKLKTNDIKICPKCGVRLRRESQTAPSIPLSSRSSDDKHTPITPSSSIPLPVNRETVKSDAGKNRNILIVAGIVVIIVVGAIILLSLPKTSTPTYTSTSGYTSVISPLEIIGNVYGIAKTPAEGIDQLTFTIGIAPGGTAVDLTKMIIVVSQPGYSTLSQLTYGDTASTTQFEVKNAATKTAMPTLNEQGQGTVSFKLNPVLTKNSRINVELRPSVGSTLPIARTAPATITAIQILY